MQFSETCHTNNLWNFPFRFTAGNQRPAVYAESHAITTVTDTIENTIMPQGWPVGWHVSIATWNY